MYYQSRYQKISRHKITGHFARHPAYLQIALNISLFCSRKAQKLRKNDNKSERSKSGMEHKALAAVVEREKSV